MVLSVLFKWTPTFDWTAAGTLGLALMTGILAIATFITAKAARDEIAASQRPVVVPTQFVLGTRQEVVGNAMAGVTVLELEISNVGVGPALDVSVCVPYNHDGSLGFIGGKRHVSVGAGAKERIELSYLRVSNLTTTMYAIRLQIGIEYGDVAAKKWHTITWAPWVVGQPFDQLLRSGFEDTAPGSGTYVPKDAPKVAPDSPLASETELVAE